MPPITDAVDRIMAVMDVSFDPAFGEAWTRRQIEDALLIGSCHYLLCDAAGALAADHLPAAGFCLSRAGFEEEELLLFAVAPTLRRRGIGEKMLAAFASSARARGMNRLLLEMRCGNPAESLYRRFGFMPIGKRPNYYRAADGSRIDGITFACEFQ